MALPLTLPTYYLNANSYVQVTITGDYYTAKVNFLNGSNLVYTTTLTTKAPLVTLPSNLAVGTFVIESGTLLLQIPSPIQGGTVTLDCMYKDQNITVQQSLNAVIASWTLNQ
jgi:hypothetical protein